MSQTRPLVAAALVLGVFIAGLVSGGALVFLGSSRGGPGHGHHGPGPRGPHHGPGGPGGPGRHGPPPPERIVEMLRERLALDDEQVLRVRDIVVAQEAAVQAAMASSRPAIEAALADGEARIGATLRPEQQPAFDAFVRERRERFPERGPPPR